MHRLVTDDFAVVSSQFAHVVHCLCKFAGSPINAVSLSALELLRECATKIVAGEVPMEEVSFTSGLALSPTSSESALSAMSSPSSSASAAASSVARAAAAGVFRFTDSTAHTGVWWPVLTGLAKLVLEQRLEVRMRALQALFGTLKSSGSGFSRPLWELIFKGVLFPIFDDVRHLDAPQEDGAPPLPPKLPKRKKKGAGGRSAAGGARPRSETGTWLSTTCLAALGTLVDLFANFFETLSFLLPDVLLLLERCIDQVRCSLLLFALLSFGCSYILLCLYRN